MINRPSAPTDPSHPILMTPTEVADMLGVTVETLSVWRSTRRYALSWTKIGRLVRYRRDAVESFISDRSVHVTSA